MNIPLIYSFAFIMYVVKQQRKNQTESCLLHILKIHCHIDSAITVRNYVSISVHSKPATRLIIDTA